MVSERSIFLICRAFAPLEICDHHNHPKKLGCALLHNQQKTTNTCIQGRAKGILLSIKRKCQPCRKSFVATNKKSDFMLPSCTNISKENCLYAFNWPYFLGILSSMLTANLPAGFIGKQEIIGGNAKLCALTFIPNNNVSLI